ncbi:hypothetical protein DFH07DRAFT_820102 [Mycena maculata]|uniref:Uncharacterized protein n=1 Tax=Mycena maculata TaxID=230809 RepID=A0AAD7J7L8_9AGAR|nr:hypothetical protein DFH07DRAFT_820102 [Mycena maculata]
MSQVPPSLFPSEHWTSDSAYITARSMKSSFGLGAALGVPLYVTLLISSKRARKFSIERLLNVSTLSGIGVSGVGGAVAYSRNALSDAATLKQRRVELVYSASQRREDDFGTIGAILGLILVPAVFYARAGLLDLTLGGGTLGYGSGFLTHHVQSFLGNTAGKIREPEIPSTDPRMRRR